MQKLITFDLDMTLLDHKDYKISPSTMLAIKKLKEEGHILAIATGRDMDSVYSREFKKILDFNAGIELNGTKVMVKEENNEKMIYSYVMPKKLVNRLLDFAINKGYSIGLSIDDYDYYTNQDFVDKLDKRRWGINFRNYKDVNLIRDMQIRTLAYVGYKDGAIDIERQFDELKLPLFAGLMGADIIEKNQSKANGLLALSKYYNIGLENIISFGDSMNDYEILKMARIGVAMGNSIKKLKEIADYVTDDIDKDGIYNACVHLGLIK